MLYTPWKDELADLLGADNTYASKFYEPEVQVVVQTNRMKFESDAEAVQEALEYLHNNITNMYSFDSLNDQENADMCIDSEDSSPPGESFNEQSPEHLAHFTQIEGQTGGLAAYTRPSDISFDLLRRSTRCLNNKQRDAYNTVLSLCRNKIKNMHCIKPNEVEPMYLFLTGGAGTGKSH